MSDKETLVQLTGIKKHYLVNKGLFHRRVKGVVKSVDGVSFSIYKGETLGLIGESGCGKSTLSRVLMGLTPKTEGEILFKGQTVEKLGIKTFRKQVQMIFQDPYSSLDPRMSIRRSIEEPLRIHTEMSPKERTESIQPLLEKIGISPQDLAKYPHEFSGGQRQRIGIARALVTNPEFIICDEPVSALDVSVQAQILNLFRKMQKDFGLTYLFISHDMGVIKHVSDRIAVMYLGRIVELASKSDLFSDTLHPYSKALMSAIPIPDPLQKNKPILLEGDLPSPLNPPPGCSFQTRCRYATDQCRKEAPQLAEIKPDHFVACHLYKSEGVE